MIPIVCLVGLIMDMGTTSAVSSEPGRDRTREGMQRNGPTETLIRSACSRIAEQAITSSNSPPRALLRPAEAPERRRGGQSRLGCHHDEESASD